MSQLSGTPSLLHLTVEVLDCPCSMLESNTQYSLVLHKELGENHSLLDLGFQGFCSVALVLHLPVFGERQTAGFLCYGALRTTNTISLPPKTNSCLI